MALITYLTRIQFDFGALKLLESELQLLGMRRPLVVTDKGVIAAGLWARVKAELPGNMPLAMYDGTPENPTEAAMRDALKIPAIRCRPIPSSRAARPGSRRPSRPSSPFRRPRAPAAR